MKKGVAYIRRMLNVLDLALLIFLVPHSAQRGGGITTLVAAFIVLPLDPFHGWDNITALMMRLPLHNPLHGWNNCMVLIASCLHHAPFMGLGQ